MEEYREIKTKLDIDDFLEQVLEFHDSILEKLNYISGNFVDENNCIRLNIGHEELPILQVVFGTQSTKRFELIFTGVKTFYVSGKADNYPRIILSATLDIKDKYIVWADEANFNSNDIDENATYIIAEKLKWKFI